MKKQNLEKKKTQEFLNYALTAKDPFSVSPLRHKPVKNSFRMKNKRFQNRNSLNKQKDFYY